MKTVFRILISTWLLCLFAAGNHSLEAQRIKVRNLEKYDRHRMHFGFLLGFNNTDFRLQRSGNFFKSDSVLLVEAESRPGFNLGIISDLRIGNNLNLRFVPNLAFSQRDISYKMSTRIGTSDEVLKKIESTFLEFPLELKFKSNRVNNYRLYVTGGFKYMIDMVSEAKVENEKDLVKLNRDDYGYTVGIGMDFYLPLYKFAPEIKMFQGIPNVLTTTDPNVYTNSLSALKSRIFSFSLTFE